jgi:hypothetical protein
VVDVGGTSVHPEDDSSGLGSQPDGDFGVEAEHLGAGHRERIGGQEPGREQAVAGTPSTAQPKRRSLPGGWHRSVESVPQEKSQVRSNMRSWARA